jgi:hypothetical protein
VPLTLTAGPPPAADPAGLLEEAAGAAKCAACGCAHEASTALAELPDSAPPRLRDAAQRLVGSLAEQRYPCLGCAVCWPAEALGLGQEAGLIEEGAACPAGPVEPRPGWPPLAGDYTMLRYSAPVAVCTLGDSDLAAAITVQTGPGGGDHRHADHREPGHRTAGGQHDHQPAPAVRPGLRPGGGTADRAPPRRQPARASRQRHQRAGTHHRRTRPAAPAAQRHPR